MYHDSATSASIVAVMASLAPQNNLNPEKTHTRSGFTSRSLSRFQDCYKLPQSKNLSPTAKDEMKALLRTRSRSTTTSSAKSNTPSIPSTPSCKTTSQPSQSIPAGNAPANASLDTSLVSTNTLSPRTRRILLRSARKVGNILGETPVLCTTLDSSDVRLSILDPSELGVLPSSSPVASSANVGRMNSLNMQTRPRPKAEMGFGMYDGLASTFVAPHQYLDLSVDLTPVTAAPLLTRVPPVLKVDCGLVTGTSKRMRQGSFAEDADAQSFISTTTTTSTIAHDLFSPSTSRRSPLSPTGMGFVYAEGAKDMTHGIRRSKVAKLSRHLGEHIPAELVFPPETEPYVLVSYENASPITPITKVKSEGDVIQPPTRTSSLRRRKRRSLQLDLVRSPSTHRSSPSSSSPTLMSPIGTAPPKYRPARALSRSHSVRSRSRKFFSPAGSRSSGGAESENVRTYPASAPAIQTVHETGDEEGLDENEEQIKDKQPEPRTPLGDAQKAVNVRRAQKMVSVFGEAPPNTLLHWKAAYESPRSASAGSRFKRHSISSITTTTSSYMELREPATFDSPITTPITPKPMGQNGGPKSPHTPGTPRRRASLSALPDTPPPFARYFEPATPLSPVSPTVARQQQSLNTPRSSLSPHSLATHSSPSSSSASPLTPGSGTQADPGAVFRERRLRAAKLARFFGVGYGDLFRPPSEAEEEDERTTDSFDTVRSVRRESSEKEQETETEKLAGAAGVSVTVQREIDVRRPSSSSSSTSASGSPEMKKMTTMTTTTTATDWDGGAVGCLSFAPAPSVARSASVRRRRGLGANVTAGADGRQSSVGTGVGVLGVFSLGRQSRGTGVSSVVRNSVNVSLGRKGSGRSMSTAKTGAGVRALTLGDRKSILSRSGSVEFAAADTGLGKSGREPARVRVGDKASDVHEVMRRLRELR